MTVFRSILPVTFGFLTLLHWVSYRSNGGLYINEATHEFGNLQLQMGLSFLLHGFFLYAIKCTFEVSKGTPQVVISLLALLISISAVTYFLTGTVIGIANLGLYEPLTITALFAFSLSLFFRPKDRILHEGKS